MSDAGLPSTEFLVILTYATSTISVIWGVMKFLCFSPQKMITLKGCWEYFSTLSICLVAPFVRKFFYGLCAYQLIVNIYLSATPETTEVIHVGVLDVRNGNLTTNAPTISLPDTHNSTMGTSSLNGMNSTISSESSSKTIFKTLITNCSTNVSSDDYRRLQDDYRSVMEDHTWFYLYILLSSIVPTLLLTLVSIFATIDIKYALKAMFKYPLILFEPFVMPFVFQGVDNITGMIKAQSADVIEWKSGANTITLSMWATDINFLNIILDGMFCFL